MGTEIERKFLIKSHDWIVPADHRVIIMQGYLSLDPVVRVRIQMLYGSPDRGFLTVKGKGTLSRAEYEYEIPSAEAQSMISLAKCSLTKTRYTVEYRGKTWEVDRFRGLLQGLWLAEIELASPDEEFARPTWLGDEVTEDPRYANVVLAQRGVPPR